ncbi:hypothetical protein EMIT0P176_260061 [Pseudomonas sp. IT-P176]
MCRRVSLLRSGRVCQKSDLSFFNISQCHYCSFSHYHVPLTLDPIADGPGVLDLSPLRGTYEHGRPGL